MIAQHLTDAILRRKIIRWALALTIFLLANLSSQIAWSASEQTAAKRDVLVKSRVHIELNKLEIQRLGQCRIYLMITNQSRFAFKHLQLDLVVLDPNGIVGQRMVVETGPLQIGKSGLRLFDIPATECGRIGKFLLNGIVKCDVDGAKEPLEPASCLALVETSTKSKVELIQ